MTVSAPRTSSRTVSAPRTGSRTTTATRTTAPQFKPSRHSGRASAVSAPAALQQTDDPLAAWKGRADILKRVLLQPLDHPVYAALIYGGLTLTVGTGVWWYRNR